MDRPRLGSTLRAIRLDLRSRQVDVARRARVSQQTVSNIEAGQWSRLSIDTLEAVAQALGADLGMSVRWRGPNLDRLLDRWHARLQDAVAAWLEKAGWDVLVEESFNYFGERGSVDILAWRRGFKALLIVEIKSELVDMQDTVRSLDAKTRIMTAVVPRSRGWSPECVGTVLVLPEVSTHRKTVAEHAALSIALPARNIEVRQWLRAPRVNLRGIWFFHDTSPGGATAKDRATRRVRVIGGGRRAAGRAIAGSKSLLRQPQPPESDPPR